MRRDLGEMRHAQDLVALPEEPERARHRVGAASPDPGVDLVEHERGRRVGSREHLLDRERQARQLAPGGDLRQWPGRLTRVRRDLEHDGVRAGRVERNRVPAELDGRFVRGGDPPPDEHADPRPAQAELLHGRLHGPAQVVGRARPAV